MSRFPVDAPPLVAATGLAPLGRLGPALKWLASVQGAWPPDVPRAARTVVVGAGAAAGAGAFLGAGAVGLPLEERVVGASVEEGVAEADAAADAGVDLLVLGASGDQVPGLVATAVLLGMEPVDAVGTLAGPDWAARTVGVRKGVVGLRPHAHDPARLVDALPGPIGRVTGLLAQSAVRRTPVLLDGSPVVLGAALLAARMAPGAERWWLAGQAPPSPAGARALRELALEPLLELQLERPEGAALAHLVLVRAVEMVRGAQE